MKVNFMMTFLILQELFDDALLTELRLYVKLNIVKKLVFDNCRRINKVKLDFQDLVFFLNALIWPTC